MCFFSSLLGICDNSCVGKNRKFNPKGVTSQHWNSLGVNGDGGEGLPASQHLLAGEERQQGLCSGQGSRAQQTSSTNPFSQHSHCCLMRMETRSYICREEKGKVWAGCLARCRSSCFKGE